MRVSVIVPTYNRAYRIEKTIESILNQTYNDLEIIVVDDGSTDNTEDVVKKYVDRPGVPVKYCKKPNGGCASARNKGLTYAEGEFIAFLDSDDQFLPDAIGSLVNSLTNTGADFVYSPSIEFDEKSGNGFLSTPAATGQPELFAKEHFLTTRARSCSILYNKKVFVKVRFSEEGRYNEDSDFLQRVAMHFKAAYSPVPTAKVYHHDENKSTNRVEICRALLKSAERTLEEYPEFKISLGDLADKRLDEIRMELTEALILANNFKDARSIAGKSRFNLKISFKLALMLNSQMPLDIKKRILYFSERVKAAFRYFREVAKAVFRLVFLSKRAE